MNEEFIEMDFDMDKAVSMSESTEPSLRPCPFILKGCPNNKLDILGMCDVQEILITSSV